MGGLIAKLKRPLRKFNIENRANAVLSRSKPIPAPKPAASIKQLQLAQELNPEFLKDHYQKNLKLDERLKNVYVTSIGPGTNTLNQPNPDRPLPVSRITEHFEFGFYIPDSVPVGKITLKEIFQLFVLHKEDTVKNSSDILAKKYKLDKETVDKLLEYYKLYQIILPKRDDDHESNLKRVAKELEIYPEELEEGTKKEQNELNKIRDKFLK
ncbi:PREDICTED: protein NDUFAF4 homolog [Polistes dominula]|uniref:Protein NDUFAF4 homolog n=1 Tax=Polistes dominula TaxID=743375 RepID=A0ABM1I6Q9_POLDO|nr:PREDICTED: protein NDUFAF4 homolog [Polistes dominula]